PLSLLLPANCTTQDQHSFPTRRSSDLTKAVHDQWGLARRAQYAHIQSLRDGIATIEHRLGQELGSTGCGGMPGGYRTRQQWFAKDRKSTRLNSSHVSISYAVFCLKKKT